MYDAAMNSFSTDAFWLMLCYAEGLATTHTRDCAVMILLQTQVESLSH